MENSEVVVMKREAKNLAQMVELDFGRTIKHSEALERVAKLRGYPNWDTAVACAGNEKPESGSLPLEIKQQIAQLIAFRSGVTNGISFAQTVEYLTNQPDKTASRGWSQVRLDGEIKLAEIFATSGLFDEGTLVIAKIGDGMFNVGSTLSEMIEYLKAIQ